MAAKARSAGGAKGGKGAKRGRTIDAEAKAAQAARARGAQGRQDRSGPGAMARKLLRDQAILAGHHLGRSTAELAREWKVTQRTVQTVIKDAGRRRSALEEAPMEIVEQALKGYTAQVEVWLAVAHGALSDGNFNAAVAAMKGHADALERYRQTLAELGKLPENLELFRMESELASLGNLVLDALDDAAEGQLTVVEARLRVKQLLARGELPVIEAKARDA